MTRYDNLVAETDRYSTHDAVGQQEPDFQQYALITATLALAEQQRIANLIAIWATPNVADHVSAKAWSQLNEAMDV